MLIAGIQQNATDFWFPTSEVKLFIGVVMSVCLHFVQVRVSCLKILWLFMLHFNFICHPYHFNSIIKFCRK